MKRAFSLFTALIFVMVMAVVGYLILSINSTTTKNITQNFLLTRADLMLKSATEYGILALHGHDFSKGCINKVDLNDSLFNAKIEYHYFLTDCNTSKCRCSKISTPDTNGSVLIYVTVTSRNPNFKIRKVRFTLQNP